MTGILSHFRIEALHNRHTIDVPITDNKLVLIGENGTGKSTVTNFIYFFLTRQWRRMLPYDFRRVVATINDKDIEFAKEDFSKTGDIDRYLIGRVPLRARQRIPELVATRTIEDLLSNPEDIARYAAEFGIPRSILIEILEHLFAEYSHSSEKLNQIKQDLEALFPNPILYLPTYRRIEQDLSAIFPEIAASSEFTNSMERLRRRSQNMNYIELVQFGMRDVEETIQRTMKNLSDRWRDDLSTLMGSYLRDVIKGAYKDAEPAAIGELNDAAIDSIFNRVDQTVLPQPEQKRLREIVSKIKREKYIPRDEDRVVIHFLTRLIKLHKDQQEKEKNIRDFVGVCNGYLSGKRFVYNSMSFEIIIQQTDKVSKNAPSDTLKMGMLSSGEKQIVSLFSQIYLSNSSNYFVIIDEPELSLSVAWQKRFLPDILNSGRCSGLVAVTHSPFICDNELDAYMRPLELFMEPADDRH
jgi:predicted ATPase